jgi:uncharacterized protein YecT (DUF1311 family)
MSMQFRGTILVLVFAFAISVPAHSASFDCRTAKHPNEKLICQSAELSPLDDKMAELFEGVLNPLNSADRQELKNSQRHWLKERLDCGDDFLCTKEVYSEHIERLNSVLPKIYVLASPPTSQVGLVLKGKYYWFHRVPPDEQCDLRFGGACYMESDATFVQVSEHIISINEGKAFGCFPAIIPDTSKKRGYESGYGKCTSTGWKSMPDSNPF